MNVAIITITSCNECPYIDWDINRTRIYCNYWRDMGVSCQSKFLYWIGDDEEIDFRIPDWCPLLEKDKNE